MTLDFLIDNNEYENGEDGEYFQGDMMMLQEQLDTINDTSDLSIRTGIIGKRYRWPKNVNGSVIVPYEISSEFDPKARIRIKLAMNDIEMCSCIEFKQRTNQSNYIKIISGRGCYSHIGRIYGEQKLSVKIGGCLTHGTIIHELMHALGFGHMHNHEDRDKFIDINWNNIKSGNEHNFLKVNSLLFNNFGTPYDYHSVMHYSSNSFSSNGGNTIVSKNNDSNKIIGQRTGLSTGDAKRLNAMYECSGTKDIFKIAKAILAVIRRILDQKKR